MLKLKLEIFLLNWAPVSHAKDDAVASQVQYPIVESG